jgi:hypothetical protein
MQRMITTTVMCGVALALAAGLAEAVTYTWQATGDGASGNWADSSNWDDVTAPGYPDPGDSANINVDNANSYTCIVDTVITDGTDYITTFNFDNTGGGSATLVITNGGRLRVNNGYLNTGARLLVSGEGSAFKKGSNFYMGGQNGVLRFENGADFHGANAGAIGLGGGPWSNSQGGQNWSLIVTGSGTTFTNDGLWLYVGKSNTSGTFVPGVSNSVYVLDGARWKATPTIGGSGPSNTYNTVTVSGVGTYFEGGVSIGASVGSCYNSLTIADGATAVLGNAAKYVGSGAGANYNELNLGAAGGAFCSVTGQNNDVVGKDGAAFNSITLENAMWTRNGNSGWGMFVGDASPSNSITINDGGIWDGASKDSIYVGNNAATGNVLRVNAGGEMRNMIRLHVGVGTGPSGNRAIIDGGSVFAGFGAAWMSGRGAHVIGGTDNQIIVQNGGVLDVGTEDLSVAAGAGNMITNSGGVYQFSSVTTPIITAGGDGIFINGGTLSFRDVSSGLDVEDHLSAPFTSLTWLGENGLRLNNSTLDSGTGYTFNSGLGATHWVRLEFVDGTNTVSGDGVTIGGGGELLFDDADVTISGDLTLESGATVTLAGTNSLPMTVDGTLTLPANVTVDFTSTTLPRDATVTLFSASNLVGNASGWTTPASHSAKVVGNTVVLNASKGMFLIVR